MYNIPQKIMCNKSTVAARVVLENTKYASLLYL